jgi:hypothetical protein
VKKSNATTYETANQTCQTKGGYLAVIDSRVQQDIVQNLIKIHMTNFTVTKAAYLFGMAFKKTFFFIQSKIHCNILYNSCIVKQPEKNILMCLKLSSRSQTNQ